MVLSEMSSRHRAASSKSRAHSSEQFSGSRRRIRVLLSIKPEFVAAILRGEKRYEFRRRIFRRSIGVVVVYATRSEEHTSELQSQSNLVCRLLLEKKKK